MVVAHCGMVHVVSKHKANPRLCYRPVRHFTLDVTVVRSSGLITEDREAGSHA